MPAATGRVLSSGGEQLRCERPYSMVAVELKSALPPVRTIRGIIHQTGEEEEDHAGRSCQVVQREKGVRVH